MSTFANIDYIKHYQHVMVPDDVQVFVVGDIHGGKQMLLDALASVGFDFDKDYLFCVGDLIDRGPDNYGVVKMFNDQPRFYSTLGNHDMFVVAEQYDLWLFNGGDWAFEGDDPLVTVVGGYRCKVDQVFQNMFLRMPVALGFKFKGKDYGVVHASIPITGVTGSYIDNDWNNVPKALARFQESAIETLVWDRNVIDQIKNGQDLPAIKNVTYVFHGHSFVQDPIIHKNRVFLDTGGIFNGRLTLAKITDDGLDFTTTDVGDQRVQR